MSDLDTFSRLSPNVLRPYLERELAQAVKYLTNAPDPVAIHRAQGRAQLLGEMILLLEQAHGLRKS